MWLYTTDWDKNAPVERVLVTNPSIETKSGAHVGTSVTELTGLFPSIEKKSSTTGNGDPYVVSDSLGQVVFDVEGEVTKGIYVLQPGVKPFSAWGSDFGPCT